MRLKNKRAVIVLFSVFIFASVLSVWRCLQHNERFFYKNDNKKIWAHRGLSVRFPENSIQSINASFENNFGGAELDIRFDAKQNRFVVSHDFPYIKQNNKLLFLQDVLQSLKTKNYYLWFDLKNLNESNVDSILNLLNIINKKFQIKNRIFIESDSAEELYTLKKAGFNTGLFLKPVRKTQFLSIIYNNIVNIYHLCIYSFDAVTMPAENYFGFVKFLYHRQNICLWTDLKNKDDLKQYTDLPEVMVILFNGSL